MLQHIPFFALSTDLLCICDFEGHFVEVNSNWKGVVGWEREELIKKNYYQFVHPEDVQKTLEASTLVQTQEVTKFVNRFRDKKGNYHWISWSGKPDKESGAFYCIGKDVSDEIGHAKYLQEVIDSIPMLVVCKDSHQDFRYTLWNRMAGNIYGYTAEQVLGKTDLDLFSKDQMKAFRETDMMALQSGKLVEIPEMHIQSRSLGERIIHVRKKALPNSNGENQFVLVVCEDITENKQMLQDLESARMQTLQSEKMATLGEMAGGIAHEINNPLSIIVGKANNLKEKLRRNTAVSTEETIKIMEKIEETGFRIHKIIKGLRTFSRDAVNDPFLEVRLSEIVESTLSLCQEKISSQHINVRTKIPPSIILEARATQISQILLNLLSNSQDALEKMEKKWIEIEATDNGDIVEISLTDSGSGIDPSLHEKIMLPFFTTKETGKGTGLGLSICSGLAKSHNGELKLDINRANTCFVLRLPKRQS